MAESTPLELLKQARAHNLLKLWATGRRQLTLEEVMEIRELHPDFQPGPAAPEGGPVAAEAPAAELPSAGEAEVTAAQLAKWGEMYGTGPRQLRRYIQIGLAHGYPCPLDDPQAFVKWWARPRMKQRVPDKILQAARRATAEAPPPAAAVPGATTLPGAPAGEATGGFNMDADLGEGDEVRLTRQLVAQFAAKVNDAMKANKADEVQLWNRHLKEALETFRKAKIDDRAEQKGRGLLMSKAEVELQIFGVLKTLANMREVMAKRVVTDLRTRFPNMPEEWLGAVAECVEGQRKKEDGIFRDLSLLKSAEDVFRLAA